MNILQLLPRLDEGGVETSTIDLARFLVKNGHKAIIISDGGRLVKKLHEVGAFHYSLPVGSKSIFAFIGTIPKIVDVIRRENIQIVHARSRLPALAGFIASRIAAVPFITTAHGYYKKHLISNVMGWGKVVVVASNAMAYHMIKNFGTLPEKIRLVPRGVDLTNFQYKRPSERKGAAFTIGIVSRVSPIKGHESFIKAMAIVSRSVPNVKALIIGGVAEGRERYREKLELLTRRLGLVEIVEFMGPRDDVPKILSQLNLLVSASKSQEAFGRSIIEAQAAGVPVVATSVGGIVDIVKDGVTGLLCSPEDPKDLAEKIIKLAKDKELRERISLDARKSVVDNFSLEKMASTTLAIYEEVLRSKKILVIKLSAIGDVVLSIPSLRAIRNKFKDAHIKVLVGLKSKDILKKCPYIDELIVYDHRTRDKGIKGFLKYSSLLRKMTFDISIDLQNNRISHALAAASLIPVRVGYDNRKFSFFLNRKIKEAKGFLDPISHQNQLLRILGVQIEDRSLEIWPSDSDEDWAARLLENHWVDKKHLLIGVNIGASIKWSTKKWPSDYFAALCDMLAAKLHSRVILTGGKEDLEITGKIMSLCRSKPIVAVGKTTVLQMASLVKRCRLFITSDSAPMHIAAACRTPFIALFGPTDPKRHLPPCDTKCVIITKKLICSPCYKSRCIRGYRCMKAITVEEVFEAVKGLLG